MTDENSDRLWTARNLFENLNKAFSKFYSPSEHLAVEVIILFKRRVIFRQYIPKKHKRFGIKIYKLCDEKGYTYMTAYSLLDGREKISYGHSRFILVNDMLETMAQIGTPEKHSTKTGLSRTLTVT
jgi:hypothetical protein